MCLKFSQDFHSGIPGHPFQLAGKLVAPLEVLRNVSGVSSGLVGFHWGDLGSL